MKIGGAGLSLRKPPFALLQPAGAAGADVVSGPRIDIARAQDAPWCFGERHSRFLNRAFAPVLRT